MASWWPVSPVKNPLRFVFVSISCWGWYLLLNLPCPHWKLQQYNAAEEWEWTRRVKLPVVKPKWWDVTFCKAEQSWVGAVDSDGNNNNNSLRVCHYKWLIWRTSGYVVHCYYYYFLYIAAAPERLPTILPYNQLQQLWYFLWMFPCQTRCFTLTSFDYCM